MSRTLPKKVREALEASLEASYQYGIAVATRADLASRNAISARDSAAEDTLRVLILSALDTTREEALREALAVKPCACGGADTWVRQHGNWQETLCRACNMLGGHSTTKPKEAL